MYVCHQYFTCFLLPVPPAPVIVSHPAVEGIIEGDTVLLTCTSPDLSRPIVWSEKTRNIDLYPPTFVRTLAGTVGTSNLTIHNIGVEHNGVYECQVGDARTNITIDIIVPESYEGVY